MITLKILNKYLMKSLFNKQKLIKKIVIASTEFVLQSNFSVLLMITASTEFVLQFQILFNGRLNPLIVDNIT